VCSRG